MGRGLMVGQRFLVPEIVGSSPTAPAKKFYLLEQMENNYKNDFEKFLSHTDEKQVLLSSISGEIEKYKVKSLLDIGAGNGLLSVPLSEKVENYLAIEPHQSFAAKLRAAGLEVIENVFPLKVPGTFDMVLASHSISYERDSFEPFVKEAWRSVKSRGIFLIITYRGQEDDWTQLMKSLGGNHEDPNRIGFNQILVLLSPLGKLRTRKVITKVRTKSLDDMVQALSFVASNGDPRRKIEFIKNKPRLEKILKQKYQDEDGYSFPFQHFFIITQKP